MAEGSTLLFLIGFVLFLVLLIFLLSAVRIVKPWQKIVIERLGKFKRLKGPGLRILIPFLEKMVIVDIREVVLDIPEQIIITEDGILVKVDAKVYYEVDKDEAQRSIYNVVNLEEALVELVQANLRNNFGEEKLEDLFAIREEINKKILKSLKIPSKDWGIKTKRVKIQNIDPVSEEVKKAMSLKMISEEEKQATVIRAEGEAEGIKKIKDSLKEDESAVAKFIGLEFIKNLKENSKYFLDFEKIPNIGKLLKEISK